MSSLRCVWQIPEVQGLTSNEMTVGRHVLLKCSGDIPTGFNLQQAVLRDTSGINIPTYRLFKIEQNGQSELILDLTFYKTGDLQIDSFILTDGLGELALTAEPLKVVSVLENNKNGKPPQPFPPILPLNLQIPAIYLWSLGAFLMLAVIWTFLVFRKRAYLKKLRERLKQYESPIDAETEFYRSLRKAEKNGYAITDLENAFKLYNLRVYGIPFFDLNEAQALKYFKSEHPQMGRRQVEISRFLQEFIEISKRQNEISEVEKKHLVKKMYRYVEQQRGGSL